MRQYNAGSAKHREAQSRRIDALGATRADDEAGASGARVTLSDMTLYVDGSWEGWSGDTIVRLTDGSVWRQDEYHYEYHYAYRPAVSVSNGKMLVKGMRKPIRVRRLT